jgi:hypothetical protein
MGVINFFDSIFCWPRSRNFADFSLHFGYSLDYDCFRNLLDWYVDFLFLTFLTAAAIVGSVVTRKMGFLKKHIPKMKLQGIFIDFLTIFQHWFRWLHFSFQNIPKGFFCFFIFFDNCNICDQVIIIISIAQIL